MVGLGPLSLSFLDKFLKLIFRVGSVITESRDYIGLGAETRYIAGKCSR